MSEPATIALDILCRRCGYNLRGLDESGRCPECGTAVGLSTRGDLLVFSDPRWLARLRLGLWLMCIGFGCVVVMQLQNFVLTLRLPYVLQPFVYFAFSLVTIAGMWLVTAPDPAGLSEQQYVNARKLIRVTVIVGLAYRVLSIGASATTVSPDMRLILQALSVIFGIVNIVGFCATCHYLAQLAGRIPRASLVRLSRHLMWWYPFVMGAALFMTTAFTILNRPRPGSPPTYIEYFMWFFSGYRYAHLAILIATIILYVRLASAVREQLRLARQNWTAAEGAVNA